MRKYLVAALIVVVAVAVGSGAWAGAQSTTGTTGGTAPLPTPEPTLPPPTPLPAPDVAATAIADLSATIAAMEIAAINRDGVLFDALKDEIDANGTEIRNARNVINAIATDLDVTLSEVQAITLLLAILETKQDGQFLALDTLVKSEFGSWSVFFDQWHAQGDVTLQGILDKLNEPQPTQVPDTPGGAQITTCNGCTVQ